MKIFYEETCVQCGDEIATESGSLLCTECTSINSEGRGEHLRNIEQDLEIIDHEQQQPKNI